MLTYIFQNSKSPLKSLDMPLSSSRSLDVDAVRTSARSRLPG